MNKSDWSEAQIARTRQMLKSNGLALVPTPDGLIHFKNLDGRYRTAPITELIEGKLEITEKNVRTSKASKQ